MTAKIKIIAGDVGGSHLTVALFEIEGALFQLKGHQRMMIDSTQSKTLILNQWAKTFSNYFSPGEAVFLALAMPAPFEYESGICLIQDQNKFKSLYQVNIKTELSKRLGLPSANIKFVNDAQAFLSGEALFGLGRGVDRILGITLGSGLGSAVKIGNRIQDADLWNSEFKDGIAEDYLGTEWFIKFAQERWGVTLTGGVKEIANSEHLDRKAFIFGQFAQNLADFIVQQYNRLKMDQVIIGGNISKSHQLFLDTTQIYLRNSKVDIPVVISEMGEKSALYGAASVFLEKNDLVGLYS